MLESLLLVGRFIALPVDLVPLISFPMCITLGKSLNNLTAQEQAL